MRMDNYFYTCIASLILSKHGKNIIGIIKYFPYSCTRVDVTKRRKSTSFNSKKHMCMINANKHSEVEGELYSYRKEFIQWCDVNCPSLFDLYGFRWDRKIFTGNKAKRALNKISIPNFLTGYEIPKTYKGEVTDKILTLSQYKYVCYRKYLGRG